MTVRLYHGSENIIENPTYGKGARHNDYGRGFYCTENLELAKEWACAKQQNGLLSEAMRLGKLGEQIVLKSPKAFEQIKFAGYECVDAEIYYTKKKEREREARKEYRRRKKEKADIDDLFILDIMREGMKNGDARLSV